MVLRMRYHCFLVLLWLQQEQQPVYTWGLPTASSASQRKFGQPQGWLSRPHMALHADASSNTITNQSASAPLAAAAAQDSATIKRTNQASTSEKETTSTETLLRELYPPSTAYENGTIKVDSLHTIYYEVHGGNKNASDTHPQPPSNTSKKSALFLHGGPGAGCTPTHARFFNPNLYDKIVLLDQRGSGRSTPRGCAYNNTLGHLVEDCEALRQHLNIEQWDVVLGGSWGSTLALAYAQEYPQRIKSIILRGVCLLRTAEVDWLFTPQGGAAQKNPQAWQSFAHAVGLSASNNDTLSNNSNGRASVPDRTVLNEYYDRLFGKNSTDRWNAARGWMVWEFTVSSSFARQQSPGTRIDNTTANVIKNETYGFSSNNSTRNATVSTQPNKDIPKSPAVLVSRSGSGGWLYQDLLGNPLSQGDGIKLGLDQAEEASSHLVQGLPNFESPSFSPDGDDSTTQPRPIAMLPDDFLSAQKESFGNFSGLPAMAMLTCFYSTNNQYAMNKMDLLSFERMERIQSIPCIAVQGGKDPICPPDSALVLKAKWPELELRIPLLAGHSMYHPEIAHELVQATDRLGSLS
jgi:proline iminopeptidase